MSDAVPEPSVTPAGAAHDRVPPLVGHLDGLVAQLAEHIPNALKLFDETAIHQARVATRRLSAAIDLLEPLIDRDDYRQFKKRLRKLRRRLGPHRDLDVLIGHVDEIAQTEAFTAAGHELSRSLRTRREELRTKALAKGKAERVLEKLRVYGKVRSDLRAHPDAYVPLLAEGIYAGFDEFGALADLLSHQLTEGERLGSIDPHELRIAGKHLRYALELCEAAGGAKAAEGEAPAGKEDKLAQLLKRFKNLQDSLGAWHDYVVLGEAAIGLVKDRGMTHRDAGSAAGLMEFAAEALRRAARHLQEFARQWTERGPDMTATLHHALPLTRATPATTDHPTEWPAAGEWPAPAELGRRPRRKATRKRKQGPAPSAPPAPPGPEASPRDGQQGSDPDAPDPDAPPAGEDHAGRFA